MNASYRSSKQVPTRVWRIVMVLALAGCSPNSGWAGLEGMEPDAGLDQVSLPLIAGEVTYERPEVGRWGGCTATLVAADAIVLAAHCRGYGSRRGPGNYGYFYIRTSSRQSHRYVVDRYRSFGSRLGRDDVLIAHLRTPVPASIAQPARLASAEPVVGDELTIYGYGCTRRGYRGDGLKRKFVYVHDRRTNQLCPGDSGGPVMTEESTVIRVNSGYYTGRRGGDIFGQIPYNFERIVSQLSSWGTVYPAPNTRDEEPPVDDGGGTDTPPPPVDDEPAPDLPLEERCAAATACGDCTAIAGCGYCWEGGRCVTIADDGGPSEQCHGGFTTPGQSCGDPSNSCGIYAAFPRWTCRSTRTGFARCLPGGTPEFLVCPEGFSCERNSHELECFGTAAPTPSPSPET